MFTSINTNTEPVVSAATGTWGGEYSSPSAYTSLDFVNSTTAFHYQKQILFQKLVFEKVDPPKKIFIYNLK